MESVRVEEQAIEGGGLKWRPVGGQGCKGEMTPCQSEEGEPWNVCDLTVVFQEAVSFFKPEQKVFQDLLKISLSSLFMLCGCISSSMAYLMNWSMYLVFTERSFVSCSLKI